MYCSCLLQPRIGFYCITWSSDRLLFILYEVTLHNVDDTSDLSRLQPNLRVKKKWFLRRELIKLESYMKMTSTGCRKISRSHTVWFLLVGYIEDRIFVPHVPRNIADLIERIIAAVNIIKRLTLMRVWQEHYHVDVYCVTGYTERTFLVRIRVLEKPCMFFFHSELIYLL